MTKGKKSNKALFFKIKKEQVKKEKKMAKRQKNYKCLKVPFPLSPSPLPYITRITHIFPPPLSRL